MNYRKIALWISFVIMITSVICLANVSAFGETKGDLIKGIGISDYGKIEIKDWYGLGSVVESIELKSNTDICGENCNAVKEIVMFKGGKLIDDVKFEAIAGAKRIEQNIPYQFYIQQGTKIETIDEYEHKCVNGKYNDINKTFEQICSDIKTTKSVEVPNWEVYSIGEEVSAGTYIIKLEGTKLRTKSIDWIITSQGIEIDDWAVWGSMGSGLVSYWTLNETTGNVRDMMGWNNGTIQGTVTRGTFLKFNNSMTWSDVDGSAIHANFTNATYGSHGNFSVSFWMNATFPVAEHFIMDYGNIITESSQPLAMEMASNSLRITSANAVGTVKTIQNTTCSTSGQIYMITVTRNDTDFRLYCNGTAINSQHGAGGGHINDQESFIIGYQVTRPDRDFIGSLDEIGWWNRSLTPEEVSNLWNSGNGLPFGSVLSSVSTTQDYPANAYSTLDKNINFSGTLIPVDADLVNATLFLYNSAGTRVSSLSKSVTGSTSNTTGNFTLTLGAGQYNWSIQGCGTNSSLATLCGLSANRTLTINNFIENSQTYNAVTTAGTLESFLINITYDSGYYNSINPTFRYNNTNYPVSQSGSGNNLIFNSSVVVPFLTTSKNIQFNWTFAFGYSGGIDYFNSTARNQTVAPLQIDNCTKYSRSILNFSLYDEDTRTNINGTIELVIDFWDTTRTHLTGTYNDSFKVYTYPLQNVTSICINNTNSSFSVDYIAKYYSNLTDYSTEFKFADNMLLTNNTQTQIISLYDLLYLRSTEFEISLQYPDLSVIQGAIIDVQRKYLPINQFISVESPKTDTDGKAIAHLVAETEYYNFVITKNGVLLATFNNYLIKCQNPSTGDCRILLNLISSAPNLPDFKNYGNVSIGYQWDKSARNLVLNFISTDSQSHNISWQVLKLDNWGNTTICSDEATALSGSLLCTVPQLYGNSSIYTRTYSDGIFLGYNYFSLFESASDIWGGTRIIFGMLMYSMLTFLMIGNPGMMIIGALLGMGFMGAFHFVDGGSLFGNTSIVLWFIIAGGIVLYYMRNKQ